MGQGAGHPQLGGPVHAKFLRLALDQRDHRPRIDAVLGLEGNTAALGAQIQAPQAQLARLQAQRRQLEQEAGRIRQGPEAIDQLSAHVLQADRIGRREALIEGQTQMHIGHEV